MLRSTLHDLREMACSSAGDSLPAPARFRSMTNLGMTGSSFGVERRRLRFAGEAGKGDVSVGTLVISGDYNGNARAAKSVEIKAPAKVRGSIITASIMIERGVFFDGTCKMDTGAGAGVPAPAPAHTPAPPPHAAGPH